MDERTNGAGGERPQEEEGDIPRTGQSDTGDGDPGSSDEDGLGGGPPGR
ncbi:hypothetical protein [Streptomyces sp. NPDC003077]